MKREKSRAYCLADPDFIGRLKDKELPAQRRFLGECWPEVLGACLNVLPDKVTASEVAMDVMADFLMHYVHKLENPRAARAYLRLMALRRSLKQKQRLGASVSMDMDSYARGETRSEEVALLRTRLEQCLAELSAKARKALILRFRGDFPDEKIGGVLGFSRQYTGRLIQKSIVALRKCLGKHQWRQATLRQGTRTP